VKVMPGNFAKGIKVIQNFRNWHTFFLDYVGILKNREVVYSLRNNIRFKARAGKRDGVIINEVWVSRTYTPVGDEIREGDTVIDIGAHIGAFSVLAANRARDVTVYSYEPFPDNFNLLKENIELNHLENIKPFPLAVSGSGGRRKLFIMGQDSHSHSLLAETTIHIVVDSITLPEIFEGNNIETCSFLKFDCERAEYEILFNTPEECFNRVKRISLEYHPYIEKEHSYSGDELVTLLKDRGFEIKWVKSLEDGYGYISAEYKNASKDALGADSS
jgi:FkbM family methyltransferase